MHHSVHLEIRTAVESVPSFPGKLQGAELSFDPAHHQAQHQALLPTSHLHDPHLHGPTPHFLQRKGVELRASYARQALYR